MFVQPSGIICSSRNNTTFFKKRKKKEEKNNYLHDYLLARTIRLMPSGIIREELDPFFQM